MSRPAGQGLRATLNNLRSALSQDGPSAGRLQLTVSTSPPPAPPPLVAGHPPLVAGHPAEAEALLSPSTSGQAAAAAALPSPSSEADAGSAPPGLAAAGSFPPTGFAAVGGEGPAAGAQANNEAADVAAAAERHRLTNAAASVDLRNLAIALERGLPYAALLLLLFISTHMVGIAVFAYLSWVLHRVNRVVRAQVALKAERSARTLLAVAGVVAAHVPLVLLVRQDIAGNLVLSGSARPTQFSDIVFAVVVGDATLRFLAVLCKVAILLVVPADSTARVRQRGHLLTAAEFVSQLYRMLPPAPLWYSFYAAQAEVPALLRTGLSGAYLLVKAQHFFERATLVALAVQQVQFAQRSYGSVPSADERQEAGNCCPICQDAYRDPTKLACGHIFCTNCLSEWFERERTCPMCRAAVGPASKKFKSFSDGRTPVFPFLF